MKSKIIESWGYNNEHTFFQDALKDENKRQLFRDFNRTLVDETAQFYVDFHNLDPKIKESLVAIGEHSFDKVFNNYSKFVGPEKKYRFLFSTYYIFWLREAYDDFVKSVKNDK